MMEDSKVDLVVVGAGWYGLMTAKTYRDVNPSANIVILDISPTIGGVWAKHHLYPGLKTNNMLGTYEYSDFPMSGENSFGVKPGEHIPGDVVHSYLKTFAQTFGIYDKCRFGEKLETATKISSDKDEERGWLLAIQRGDASYTLRTRRLVMATGLHSTPFLPKFVGAADSSMDIIHCSHLLQHSEKLFANSKNVAVFGGTKSAWDAAYTFASKGIHVDMIIRESGRGPCWMAPPYVTPLKKWLEKLIATRFLTWLSPCVWGDADGFGGIRGLLHGTAAGRKLVNGFWGVLGNDVITSNEYDKHPETAKLKPWVDAFWVATGLSILNYPSNFFDFVKEGKITVHVADISKLSEKSIHLTSTKEGDSIITVDALLCATGFQFIPSVKFLSENGEPIDASTVGIPHHADSDNDLMDEIDKEILTRFPRLKDQPKLNPASKPLRDINGSKELNRPYVLYRFMVPPAFINDRSIAFAGSLQSICTALIAQSQALWLAAYFGQKLKLNLDDEAKVKREAILHARFGKWRCPGGSGSLWPDFVFDSIPYVDLLLADVGLNGRRKGGMLKECFQPYGTKDYLGLVEEWKKTIDVRE
ncbi:hypothetical protein BGX38DRAFT_1266322 [Terfezia claveryi]|nr:hypothetical protein BGX38DRAFT_1266322 [Terfezia claveryi]